MTAPPPLLAIAEGRKARARKAPVYRPRESKLHVDVAKLLRDHRRWDWDWRFINAKAKDAREGAIMKRMGANPGWPDFILLSPHGSVRFLEIKRIGEDIDWDSPQGQFKFRCIQRGIPHVTAHTIDEVGAACDEWGCLRVKFSSAHADGARP